MNLFEKNRVIFEVLEYYITKMDTLEDIQSAIAILVQYAVRRPTTYYSSKVIEELLISKAIDTPLCNEKISNSILIITNLTVGGSFKILREDLIKELGRIYKIQVLCLSKITLQDLQDFRYESSKYEKIIYIPRPDEIIPILCFSRNFNTPIITINACNNLFSLSNSITDIWVDLTEDDAYRSINKRGIERDRIRVLPLKGSIERPKKVPQERIKHIYSIGGQHKYSLVDDYNDFFNLTNKILNRYKDITITTIGFNNISQDILKKKHDRLILSKHINHKLHLNNMLETDLYLDSFPINGYTTLIEANNKGVPSIGWRSKGGSYQPSTHDLLTDSLDDLINWIDSPVYTDSEEFISLYVNSWSSRLHNIISNSPSEHSIFKVTPNNEHNDIDLFYNISAENQLDGVLFNYIELYTNKDSYGILKIMQEFSKRNNKGLI